MPEDFQVIELAINSFRIFGNIILPDGAVSAVGSNPGFGRALAFSSLRSFLMTEYLKSLSSMSLALCLLPLRQIENTMNAGEKNHSEPNVRTMDDITGTVVDHFGNGLRDAFSRLDKMQRTFFNMGARMFVGERDHDRHHHHRHSGVNHPENVSNLA